LIGKIGPGATIQLENVYTECTARGRKEMEVIQMVR
jgi:hypothetical protein